MNLTIFLLANLLQDIFSHFLLGVTSIYAPEYSHGPNICYLFLTVIVRGYDYEDIMQTLQIIYTWVAGVTVIPFV